MSYADHDLTIYRDANGCPIATDLGQTISDHRQALDRMACELETLCAQFPETQRYKLQKTALLYRRVRTTLNTIED